MGNVVIALLPAVIAAGLIFGVQALVLVAVTTLACVAFEYIYDMLLKKPNTVGDLSAVVTGIILALNMPRSEDTRLNSSHLKLSRMPSSA